MRPRETIAGRYELERAVRTGGISVVYRARDLETGDVVAVKVMNITEAEAALRRRIERETSILRTLSHPHIVRCHDAGQLGEARMFLVLEWLEGEDLADFMARAPMTLRQTLHVVEQVAGALALAHASDIIHRDIKPANIYLVTPEVGAPPDCRVLDFGVAKIPESKAALTRAGAILGTPSYMAPEQASVAMSVDGRADLFSLGVVAFELLTGKLPWMSGTDLARLAHILVEEALPVQEVAPGVPPAAAGLIDSMLEKELADRIDSALAVQEVARGCLDALSSAELDVSYASHVAADELVRAPTLDLLPRLAEASEPSDRTHVIRSLPNIWDDPSEATISALEAETGEGPVPAVAIDPSIAASMSDDELSYVDHLPASTMFGRVTEVDRLRSRALTPLTTARPSYTLVVGPAGIGKTRIRTELTRVLRQAPRPPRVFAGRAEEAMRDTPYAYARKVLFALAGIHARDHDRTRREKVLQIVPSTDRLRSLLEAESGHDGSMDTIPPVVGGRTLFFTGEALQEKSRHGAGELELDVETERATIAAFTSEALRVFHPDIPPVVAARGDPRLLGEQLHRALVLVLRSLSRPDGLIVLIDDVHLLDRPSGAIFADLLAPDRETSFAMIAFALPHYLDPDTRLGTPLADVDRMFAEVIELLPLEPRPSRELVRNLLDEQIEPGALEMLVNRAKGNPLYLEQLVRAVQANGVLAKGATGELVLTPPKNGAGDGDRIPPTVAAAVSARIFSLTPREQRVLTAAAVFGEIFWSEGVAAIAEEDVEDVAFDLDRLTSINLVRRRQASRYQGTTELEFTHAVIRSVALSRLKRNRRQTLEGRVVAYLERVRERDAAVLGAHLAQSGQVVAAARRFGEAATSALELGDAESASALAEAGLRSMDGVDDTDVRRSLLDVAEHVAIVTSDYEAGRDALDALADLETDALAQAKILLRRSRLAYSSKRYEEAVIESDGAKAAFEARGDEAGVAQAELCRAEACEALGDGRGALRSYLLTQPRLSQANDASGLARVGRGLARIAVASGDYRTAENRFRGSLVQASALRDHDLIFTANIGLADVARLLGDATRAREFLSDAGRVAFDEERKLLLRVHQARILIEERRGEEAYDRLERIYSTAEDVRALGSVRRLSALLRGQMLRVRPGSADEVRPTSRRLASVESHLERALGSAATEEPSLTMALKLALAVVLALRGDEARAKKTSSEALERFDKEGAVMGDEPPWIFYASARVLQLTGASAKEVEVALRSAISHLDSITGRLERKDRQRYLDRWVARAIVNEAQRAGLSLTRHVSSSRLVLEE